MSKLPGADPISVSFTLQYGDELSQAESEPIVSCYFSRPVRGNVVHVPVPEDNAGQATQVRLEGFLASGTLLPADTKIVFYATCMRENDFGVPCRVAAGIGRVDLSFLASSANASLQMDVPLTMPSAGNIEKGLIRITTTRAQVAIASRIRWESIGGGYANRREQSPVEAEMIEYINNVMRTEMAMPNTFEDTGNVRIAIYYSDFGMLKANAPLPAAAYFMCQVPDSNRRFWTNALDVVLAREGQVVHDVDRMTLQEQARVMADVNCLLIQGLDYIGDTVDQNKRAIAAAPGFIGKSYSPGQLCGSLTCAQQERPCPGPLTRPWSRREKTLAMRSSQAAVTARTLAWALGVKCSQPFCGPTLRTIASSR